MLDTSLLIIAILVILNIFFVFVIRHNYLFIRDINDAHDLELRDKVKKSLSTQRSVIKGQLAEQMFPVLAEMNGRFKASDMMFNGKLFDYLVFEGYTESLDGLGKIRRIVFMDIKTGKAQLLPHQEELKQAIRRGDVDWITVRIDDFGGIKFEY